MSNEGPQQSLRLSIVVSSGAGTGTLTNQWSVARYIRIKPASETDTFNVVIKDADGMIMANRTAQLGTLSEKFEMSLGIMSTIAISSASADGTYTVKFDLN